MIPAAPTGPVFNPNTQAALDNLPLSGVRIAGDNSRILINGDVYALGDTIVEGNLKLKFVSVAPREIIFVDDSGAQYTKRF
jgi:hypothetical protein